MWGSGTSLRCGVSRGRWGRMDRPQVHITLDLETLTTGLGTVALLDTGGAGGAEGLSAGEARRLACDAGLIPVVLGTASRPLDVGRAHRLFTPAIRGALLQRDRGDVCSPAAPPPRGGPSLSVRPRPRGGVRGGA
ncbi:DUF222 domain-containing protein [Tessaracoccus sp. Z1128]